MRRFPLWGLGIAILTTAADAAVVVTRLPDFGFGLGDGRYEVDIDGDGSWEVAFVAISGIEFSAVVQGTTRIQVIPSAPPNLGSRAWPLTLGEEIGSDPSPSAQWENELIGGTLRGCTDLFCVGNWPAGTFTAFDPETDFNTIFPESGYLAVEFTNDTGLHYGWIDVGVIGFFPTGRIYGWGWETEPDTAVTIIPESSQILLAASGLVVALIRRRRT